MNTGDPITAERLSQSESHAPDIEGYESRLDQRDYRNRNPEAATTMIPATGYPDPRTECPDSELYKCWWLLALPSACAFCIIWGRLAIQNNSALTYPSKGGHGSLKIIIFWLYFCWYQNLFQVPQLWGTLFFSGHLPSLLIYFSREDCQIFKKGGAKVWLRNAVKLLFSWVLLMMKILSFPRIAKLVFAS